MIDEPSRLHIGYIVRMQYESVDVLTNDFFKERVNGIPQNSFLLASPFDPEKYENTKDIDKVVLLLRVQGPCKLPQDDTNLVTMIEHLQSKSEIMRTDERDGIEPITHSLLQFGGLNCRVLGSFFLDDSGRLQLGADIEDFQSVAHMRVYKPSNEVLARIVNYIDPIKQSKATSDSKLLGFNQFPEAFNIGHVRYTSTNRLQKHSETSLVPVNIQPTDFLARRTAVLGMTRTGKSNTIKTTVSAVALAAVKAQIPVGQLIFDINGEYANATGQDDGSSIAEVFSNNVVRYRGLETPGFFDLRDNFYQALENGLELLQFALQDASSGEDMQSLLNLSLEKPSEAEHSKLGKWRKTVAIYKVLLFASGFGPSTTDTNVQFTLNDDVRLQIFDYLSEDNEELQSISTQVAKKKYIKEQFESETGSLDLDRLLTLLRIIRDANKFYIGKNKIGLGKDKAWLESQDIGLLNLMVSKSSRDTPIRGTRTIKNAALEFHSPLGSENIANDIYEHLRQGRIVILDLSVGAEKARKNISNQIAQKVFRNSFRTFTAGNNPPAIVLYVEEAHNLIGRDADFNTTWPRIAKEGAKAKIGLVYATQEPSSVHTNILANTENFFVTHLNNDDELRALGKYYDFADFSGSLKKAQDVGFARIKTLSSPFVIPTQILLFKPSDLKAEYDSMPSRHGFIPAPFPN